MLEITAALLHDTHLTARGKGKTQSKFDFASMERNKDEARNQSM
jgi:hypothetical protein